MAWSRRRGSQNGIKRPLPALWLTMLLLLAGAVAAYVAGCGAAGTTTSTIVEVTSTTVSTTTTTTDISTTTSTQPSTTTTTEPPPLPLVLPGYEEAEVRSISVVVDDSYPKIDEDVTPPLAEMLISALETMGLLAEEQGQDCDATLTFELEGRALSDVYSGDDGNERHYSGAAYTGSVEFVVQGLDSERWEISGRLDPPFGIFDTYLDPTDAPFDAALLAPMLATFTGLWGPVVTIETIGIWPSFDDVIWDGAGDWLAEYATDIMPRLMELRLSDWWDVSWHAYDALVQIVERKAVPAEDRSTIVRALISDMDDPGHYAGQALTPLAQPEEDGYYSADGGMTYVGPWEAERWTEWADAHGY